MSDDTPTAHLCAVDLVRPLVGEAALMYRAWLAEESDAKRRRVDPSRSPRVREAAKRLDGACAVLARMWQLLGMDPAEMDARTARRVVAEQVRVDDARSAGVDPEPQIVVV